jgi:succinyl-diaminopimelate desuccinylase
MDYVKTLSDLISINTSAPPGDHYREAMEHLSRFFLDAGFVTEMIDIPSEHAEGKGGRVNLVCHRRSPGKPRLILYNHVDVVPAAGWDAFKARFVDGKIYGRGAADMKGGIVALLGALEMVRGNPLKYDVSVAVTTDEEVSQATQLRYLARFLDPVKGAYVLSLDNSFGYVSVAGLGALQMDIRVKGKSVHSGLSHLGSNAIERSVPLLQALMELKAKVVKRESKVGAHPDTGLSRMQARLNINMISGGIKVNIVPDHCLISIDRRLIPEEDIADVEKEILDCLSSVPGAYWEAAVGLRIPTVPPCEGPVVDDLAATIKRVTGSTGKFGEMGSGDLSRIVTTEWNGKEFGLGVIRPECNIHGNDEFVYLRDIEAVAEIIAEFLV